MFADLVEPRVRLGERELAIVGTYAEAKPGALLGVVNSFGTLEIACRDGSAASTLGAGAGTVVHVSGARFPRNPGLSS